MTGSENWSSTSANYEKKRAVDTSDNRVSVILDEKSGKTGRDIIGVTEPAGVK